MSHSTLQMSAPWVRRYSVFAGMALIIGFQVPPALAAIVHDQYQAEEA